VYCQTLTVQTHTTSTVFILSCITASHKPAADLITVLHSIPNFRHCSLVNWCHLLQSNVHCCKLQLNRLCVTSDVADWHTLRRPSSDLTDFTTAMSHIMAKLSVCQSVTSNVTHETIIMGDFNLDSLEKSTPARMTAVLPVRQLVSEVTTDYASALDHVYINIPADHIQCYTGVILQ